MQSIRRDYLSSSISQAIKFFAIRKVNSDNVVASNYLSPPQQQAYRHRMKTNKPTVDYSSDSDKLVTEFEFYYLPPITSSNAAQTRIA